MAMYTMQSLPQRPLRQQSDLCNVDRKQAELYNHFLQDCDSLSCSLGSLGSPSNRGALDGPFETSLPARSSLTATQAYACTGAGAAEHVGHTGPG